MKYVLAKNQQPIDGVDVHIVTANGVKSIARYWALTEKWLTNDKNIEKGDIVYKWKYENAKLEQLK